MWGGAPRPHPDTPAKAGGLAGRWRTWAAGSAKYMDRYLNEFAFRSNHRQMENTMFDLLVGAL